MAKPDFIIIGAMKCATSTLQEQLAAQDGIFMCTPKEPNFFSNDEIFAKGINWYESLFEGAGEDALKGEASTHYTKLPTYPQTIARLKNNFPEPTKLIYVMRHPVDRLISHYIHEWTMGNCGRDIESEISQHPEFVDYGRYAYQLGPYIEVFGKESILPVFFNRLKKYPDQEFHRICSFIGYQGEAVWTDLKPSNVSSERIRRFPFYNLLVESSFAKSVRRRLISERLTNRIKASLQMSERPALSAETRKRLEAVFDEDLQLLGEQLGLAISCETFEEVSSLTEPELL